MKGNSITHSNHDNNNQNIRRKKIKIEDGDNDNNTKRSITTNDTSMNSLYMLLKNNYNSEGNNLFRGPLRQALLASNHIYAGIIEEDEHNIFANGIATYNNINSNNDLLITACMTNPPFYNTDEDIIGYDNTICTASNVEKFTEGGELAFLTAIIADSFVLQNRYLFTTIVIIISTSFNMLSQIGFVGLHV